MSTTTINNALEALAAEVGAYLGTEGEHLVYINRGDRLTDDQVDLLVSGESGFALLDEDLDEWHSEVQHMAAQEVVDDAARDIVHAWQGLGLTDEQADDLIQDFEYSDERDELVMTTRDLDTSDPIRDLARETPAVLIRVPIPGLGEGEWCPPTGEDAGFAAGDLYATIYGNDASPSYGELAALESLLDEVPSIVYMGYWLFAVQPGDLYDIAPDDIIEVDAILLMGNPFTGGYAESGGTFKARIRRGDLRTDRDAFGYSWTETAGPVVSYYETEVRTSR